MMARLLGYNLLAKSIRLIFLSGKQYETQK